MNLQEIRNKIDENNKKMREILENKGFVLTNEIEVLLEENEKIRENCTHEFYEGICKWCDEFEVKAE